MKSPFPGMDPYLEQHWLDVHSRLCMYSCDALQPQVRPALVARVEERLVVQNPDIRDRQIFPDVKVVRHPHTPDRLGASPAAVLDEPLILQTDDEPATECSINILDPKTGGKIITVIEFLTHSNKFPGPGQDQYLQKQQELLQAGVSLVEIDLLRGGNRIQLAPDHLIPDSHRTLYRICVHRGWKAHEYELYRATLEYRLPTIGIPLREKDADAKLNLQAILDLAYENGAYDTIDYTKPPDPPLDKDSTSWANELLTSAGKR